MQSRICSILPHVCQDDHHVLPRICVDELTTEANGGKRVILSRRCPPEILVAPRDDSIERPRCQFRIYRPGCLFHPADRKQLTPLPHPSALHQKAKPCIVTKSRVEADRSNLERIWTHSISNLTCIRLH